MPCASSSSSDILHTAALCLILVLYSTRDVVVNGFSPAPNKTTFPAILAFGDSVLDTGNNNYLFTLATCNFAPYGRDFPGGNSTGRFGNGKVFSDLLAEALGIKPLLPPYLDPHLHSGDLETGVSFASGGAGLDDRTVKLQNTLSVNEQLHHFKKYVAKLQGTIGLEKTNAIVSDSVILVSLGNNDIAITYFAMPYLFDIDDYTTHLANSALYFIREMHDLGARKFAYLSTLPVGHLPAPRTFGGGVLRNPVTWLDQAAVKFNTKLGVKLKRLSNRLPGTKLVYVDMYNPLMHIIENPNKYGFEVANRGCCGTGFIEIEGLCNRFNPFTCSNSSTHVFWDAGHPTERTYRIILSQVLDKIKRLL